MKTDLQSLLSRLNPYCMRALEGASGLCVNRGHYEVSVEHVLLQLLEDPQSDVPLVLWQCEIDTAQLTKGLHQELEGFKTGNPGKPVFSQTLLAWFEEAWPVSSLKLGESKMRSVALLATLTDNPLRFGLGENKELQKLSAEKVLEAFGKVHGRSVESVGEGDRHPRAPGGAGAPQGETALKKFTQNFTERAREGKIDPVFGRDREIRQMIDILGRRRKNNPICVGEAGVGKSAVVEGLALKVAAGDVPDILKDVDIVGLDLGLLQAGASVKGEFENRLNAVLTEIKASETPIILFIDEAHTLIGAGGAAGTGDAANLLKPALARGELRTIAATTWSEYKKYFEKDPALARRFQLVKLDEPNAEEAAVILRGLRETYEKAHGVYVRDDAIVTAASLSARYISGRQLPDKAVDVLDTACARVKISMNAPPDRLEDMEQRAKTLKREHEALARDVTSGRSDERDRLDALSVEIDDLETGALKLTADWEREKEQVAKVVELRVAFDKAREEKSKDADKCGKELSQATEALEALQGDHALIHYEVTPDVVARVVADWTGIPLGSVQRDQAASLLSFNEQMKGWVIGQDHAVDLIDSGLRTAKAGLQNPDMPMGVFLFVGPSGVGKTETALGVANLLFGGDRFMVTVNMSEFQEKHTVSKLVGSPPGYVGYGEGGVLTEAVRQRPYSVVLLDEVEKADLEVLNLFYQVFDKGTLADGEGRVIDFRNTILFLTSNLASDIIMQACAEDEMPSVEELTEAIRPVLQQHFKPALLARMNIVPFYPIKGEALARVVRIKLDKVVKRLKANRDIELTYDDKVVAQIAARCTDVESGARNVDHIINRTLLPMLSTEILKRTGGEDVLSRIQLAISDNGGFEPVFSS
ncbi:MAG TPA: type VI secretion system ATPase TssH [Gammaproteobacteria bacterium]